MTAPAQLAAVVDATARVCDVCTHPDAAHDDIARRYCNATMTNALPRECICRPSP